MVRFRTKILIVNVALFTSFFVSTFIIWNLFNNQHAMGYSHWNPLWVSQTLAGEYDVNGNFVGVGGTQVFPNVPFMIFCIIVGVNLFWEVKEYKKN